MEVCVRSNTVDCERAVQRGLQNLLPRCQEGWPFAGCIGNPEYFFREGDEVFLVTHEER